MKCERCRRYSWILYKYSFYDRGEKLALLCYDCTRIAMTYEYEVYTYPRDAGDFGVCKMSDVYRSPWEEKRIVEQIKKDISRHVDNIGGVYITYKRYTPSEFWYKDVRVGKK